MDHALKVVSSSDILKEDITYSEEYRGFTLAAEWTSSTIVIESFSGTYIVPQHMWSGYIAPNDQREMPVVPPGQGIANWEFALKGSKKVHKGLSMMFHMPDYICVGTDGTVGNVSALGHGRNIICTKDRVFAELRQMADHFIHSA